MKILSTRKIKARNPNTGKLEGVNFFAENATKDYLNQIDKKGKDVLESLPDDYIEITKDVSELSEEIIDGTLINVFDKNDPDIVVGKYIIDFEWFDDPTFNMSGFIKCKKNDVIRYAHWRDGNRYEMQHLRIAFYDENKNNLQMDNLLPATAPADGFFRMPFYAGREDTTLYTINTPLPETNDAEQVNFEVKRTVAQRLNVYGKEIDDLNKSANEKSHWNGKLWYAYGTSLTSTAQGKYAQYIAQFSGLHLSNMGIPGGGLVSNRNIYNALMDNTDGKVNADLITIEVGANDYSSPLGDVSSMNTSTFCGALNTCLQNVLSNCPKAQVVLMCSTRQPKSDDGLTLSSLDNKNLHGVTYEERDEAIRRVAAANGVYFIPFGSGLGLGLFRMQSSGIYNVDHIHHTNLGGYNLAQGVWAYLRNIPLWYNTLPE